MLVEDFAENTQEDGHRAIISSVLMGVSPYGSKGDRIFVHLSYLR